MSVRNPEIDTYICCGDCKKKLLNLVVTENNQSRIDCNMKPLSSIFIVKCTYCGGSSFEGGPFEGTCAVQPVDGLNFDLEDTFERPNGTIVNIISTKKI